jgi:hypothetical protein
VAGKSLLLCASDYPKTASHFFDPMLFRHFGYGVETVEFKNWQIAFYA